MYDTNHLHYPHIYHSNFPLSFVNNIWTIFGTKYPSHYSISCRGISGILERYKTWQMVAYITVKHVLLIFPCASFSQKMINTSWWKLGDTSRQCYIRQIPVWHRSGHVRHDISIGVLYRINIHVSSLNDVFLSSSLVNMFSNDDIIWVKFPLGCRYIPPRACDSPLYINSIKKLSNSHFEQLHDFVNPSEQCSTVTRACKYQHLHSCYYVVVHNANYSSKIELTQHSTFSRPFESEF